MKEKLSLLDLHRKLRIEDETNEATAERLTKFVVEPTKTGELTHKELKNN